MTDVAERPRHVARIWVALDSASQNEAALEVATALARDARAEVAGLYVEDADLLRLAGLPMAAEMNPLSTVLRPIGTTDIERQLRGQAARIERDLARRARHAGLAWSFHVRRGNPLLEALALAAAHEVMVLGGRRLAPPQRPALAPRAGPVVLLLDGDSAAPAAKSLAHGAALRLDARLEVLSNTTETVSAARRAEVRMVMAARQTAPAADLEGLGRLLAEMRCPLVLA